MKVSKQVEARGELFLLRPTFDIIDFIEGIYGVDVYDETGDFLIHYDNDDEEKVISQIEWDFYRVAD